ncbi:recombinase zinc beta ribbon domain-containing protein [Amycolatopsis sp. NPDC003865]
MKRLARKAEEGGTPLPRPDRLHERPRADQQCARRDRRARPGTRQPRPLVPGAVRHRQVDCGRPHTCRSRERLERPAVAETAQPTHLRQRHAPLAAQPVLHGGRRLPGHHYEGKHQPLIERETWLAIQDALASHNHTGEKDRKHTHYLRGTIYCSECGDRLVYSQTRGRSGLYEYYCCLKKRRRRRTAPVQLCESSALRKPLRRSTCGSASPLRSVLTSKKLSAASWPSRSAKPATT